MAVAVLLCLSIFFVWQTRQTNALNTEGHLVTIFDRGEEQVFVSNAETIGDVLKEAGIETDARDVVEPALNEQMVASEYQVNIYRARPVTVIDGAMRQKVMTAYQTPEHILAAADITVYPEDTTELTRSDDLLNGAGLQLEIDRAVLFTFDLYGAKTDTRTQGDTVGAMLEEKGIELGDADRVSPSSQTTLTEGMTVRVWREGKQTITREEKIDHGTREIKDADQPIGYEKVQTAGKNGTKRVTYEIEIKDGREVSREEIASLTLKKAVTEVVIIGTKPEYLPYTGGGSKTDWLAASNISKENWGYADALVTRESGWNPNAINQSSGACGLAQALPCSKVPGNPMDPVNSLNWMNGYVTGRYGGWQQAYNFWMKNRWY